MCFSKDLMHYVRKKTRILFVPYISKQCQNRIFGKKIGRVLKAQKKKIT